MEPELKEIYKTIKEKRILLGHPTEFTKQRKNTRFSSDIRFIVSEAGCLPYKVK